MKDFWNERFSGSAYTYGEEPNAFLKEQLALLQPGSLLLPAEGEGRNAVYAAKNGWQVLAFDYSEAGKEKAYTLAAKHGVSIDYLVADATDVILPKNHFDTAAWIFGHYPPALSKMLLDKIWQALKPGGILIMEVFSPKQLGYSSGGPKDLTLLYAADQLREACTDWEIDLLEEVETVLDEGPYHQGIAAVTRLRARKPYTSFATV